MTLKQTIRIIIFVIVGIAVSFGVTFLMITIGYAQAYATGVSQFTVTFFGIPIYDMHRVGDILQGDVNSTNIGIVGFIVGLASVIIAETFSMWIGKKRAAKTKHVAEPLELR